MQQFLSLFAFEWSVCWVTFTAPIQASFCIVFCDFQCFQVKIMGENCTNLGLQCGPLDCAPVSGEGYKAFLDRMISDIKVRATARAHASKLAP